MRPSKRPSSPIVWFCEIKMNHRSSGCAVTQLSRHQLKLASWREFVTLSLPKRTFSLFFDKPVTSRESHIFFPYFFRYVSQTQWLSGLGCICSLVKRNTGVLSMLMGHKASSPPVLAAVGAFCEIKSDWITSKSYCWTLAIVHAFWKIGVAAHPVFLPCEEHLQSLK